MKTNLSPKLLSWLVITLLLINAVTLVLFWLGKPKGPEGPKGKPQDFLIEQLHFNGKQKAAFLVLAEEHRDKTEELRDKIKAKKDAFFDLVKLENVNDSTKRIAAKEASVLIEELDLFTLEHFRQIRALCDPTQKELFDKVIKEMIGMMGAPRPAGPPPPDGPPPGGNRPRPE